MVATKSAFDLFASSATFCANIGRLVGCLLRGAEMRAHDGLRAHHAERENERPLVLVEDAGLWPRQAEHATQLAVRPDGNDGCRGCAGADHRGAPRG